MKNIVVGIDPKYDLPVALNLLYDAGMVLGNLDKKNHCITGAIADKLYNDICRISAVTKVSTAKSQAKRRAFAVSTSSSGFHGVLEDSPYPTGRRLYQEAASYYNAFQNFPTVVTSTETTITSGSGSGDGGGNA